MYLNIETNIVHLLRKEIKSPDYKVSENLMEYFSIWHL